MNTYQNTNNHGAYTPFAVLAADWIPFERPDLESGAIGRAGRTRTATGDSQTAEALEASPWLNRGTMLLLLSVLLSLLPACTDGYTMLDDAGQDVDTGYESAADTGGATASGQLVTIASAPARCAELRMV